MPSLNNTFFFIERHDLLGNNSKLAGIFEAKNLLGNVD